MYHKIQEFKPVALDFLWPLSHTSRFISDASLHADPWVCSMLNHCVMTMFSCVQASAQTYCVILCLRSSMKSSGDAESIPVTLFFAMSLDTWVIYRYSHFKEASHIIISWFVVKKKKKEEHGGYKTRLIPVWSDLEQNMQHISSMSLSYSVVKQLDKQKESNPNRERWCETQGGGRWSSAVTKGTKTTLQTGRAPPDLFSLFYVLRRTFRSSIFSGLAFVLLCYVECHTHKHICSMKHDHASSVEYARPQNYDPWTSAACGWL